MTAITKTEQVATADDGSDIRYAIWSTGGGVRHRAVLVHSLAMNAEFWDGTAAALGDGWEVLAPDCRGHGSSAKPAGPYSVELFASDLAAVMDHAGWEQALIGGASMGGCVSLAFAAAYPDRVRGLGLIDTTAWYGETATGDWEERGQKAVAAGMSALTEFQKSRWFSDAFREANPANVATAIEVFNANDVDAYLETCRMLGRVDMRDALSGFSFPTGILVGEEDYATPIAMAEAMQAAIPNATLDVVTGARHFTPLEVPDRIAAFLANLAERNQSTTGSMQSA